jgi:high-affinity nickel-transport protein
MQANDQSGFIGAAIVGGFALLVGGWYAVAWIRKDWARKKEGEEDGQERTGASGSGHV